MNTHEISTRINLLVHVSPDDIIDEIACIEGGLFKHYEGEHDTPKDVYDWLERAYPLLNALKEAMK